MADDSNNPLLSLQQNSAAITPLPIQPLELTDFSGGLTENYFDSTPNRYQEAKNFIINVDGKLQERYGTIPFDPVNYTTGNNARVDALFTLINESRLIINQGRDIYVLPETVIAPTWTRLTGPSGNSAIGVGTPYFLGSGPFSNSTTGTPLATQFGLTTLSEYNHQAWVTQDAMPIPSRIYRDQNNNYQVRTAGLPRCWNQANYNASTLLSVCITNANALQAAFVNHLNDCASTVGGVWANNTQQHAYLDKYSLSYLSSSYPAWNPITDPEYPGPGATAASPATNLATLFTLVGALNTAYTHHATASVSLSNYHWQCLLPLPGNSYGAGHQLQPGPIAYLSNNTTPTSLYNAALMLDDLYQKLYWHMYGVNLHGGTINTVSTMARYDYTSTISKIGTVNYSQATGLYINASPVVTPMIQDFLDYVNGLHALWNWHCGGGGNAQINGFGISGSSWTGGGTNDENLHMQPDTNNFCTLPIATTLDQAYLKIYWLRTLFGNQHVYDANNITTTAITFSSTAGSANITTNIAVPANTYIFTSTTSNTFTATAGTGQNAVACVISGGGTTSLTLDRTVIANNTNLPAYFNTANQRYHCNFASGAPQAFSNYQVPLAELLTSSYTSLGTDMVSWNAYAQEFMYCLFNHMTDGNIHSQTNIPSNDTGTFSPTTTPGVNNWYIPSVSTISFAFTYYYTWTVEPNGLQYVIESNPVYSASIETIEPLYVGYQIPIPTNASTFLLKNIFSYVQNPITITGIPAIVNDGSTNYDTANIQVRVYRTTNGGTTFYLDQTLTNGTTSMNDVQNGSVTPPGYTALNLNTALYTSGGVVGNDQPPPCKCMHILAGTAYYGNIIQGGQYLPNTICQSIPQNPDSAPATFTDTYDDEVLAISSSRTNVVVFCRNSVYRLAGSFNTLGQGQLSHEKISATIGCLGPHSVVQTEIGIFFAGTDGFYYTDGFQLIKVSIDLNKTYQAATTTLQQKARVYGSYDKTTRRVWWSLQSNPSAVDNNLTYIYYLDYGVKPSGVFTTASNNGSLVPTASTATPSPSVGNPLNYDYWSPSATVFFQGVLIKGDARGIITKMDPNSTTDPKVDLTIPAFTFASGVPTQNWNTVALPYTFTSSAMDFGTHWKRKYATRVNWTGKNIGNAQVQFVAISDNGRVVGNMAPVNYTQNCIWGNPNIPWGATSSPTFNWYYGGSADFWRRFPAGTLRANLRQIKMSNAFMGVYRSEDWPSGCTISLVAGSTGQKVVTLATPASYPNGTINWPLDVVDYFLTTNLDGYVAQYQICAVSGNTLTVLDPNNALPTTGNYSWVIMGYKKSMTLVIDSIVIRYAVFGDKTSAWQSQADSGMNN